MPEFRIDIAPTQQLVTGAFEFTWHVWEQGNLITSGYGTTPQDARERAHEAVKRHVDNPPIKEDFTYGE